MESIPLSDAKLRYERNLNILYHEGHEVQEVFFNFDSFMCFMVKFLEKAGPDVPLENVAAMLKAFCKYGCFTVPMGRQG